MILIVTAVFPPEPIVSANLSFDIAERLSEKGENITVISPKPSRPFGHKLKSDPNWKINFSHEVLDSYVCAKSKLFGRLRESMSFGLACKNYIHKNASKISAIYMNSWPLFAQFYVIKQAKKNGIPVIMHVQDIYPESITKKLPSPLSNLAYSLLNKFENFNMRNVTKVIAISPNMKSYLSKTRPIQNHKIEVVRNWQNDNAFINFAANALPSQNEVFTFMYAGSISASAGVDHIIQSFIGMANNDNSRLVIAGSGSEKEKCQKLAEGKKNIEFWDAPYKKIPEIQSKADILLLSLMKGIGLTASPSKFTAYLLSKKPVIASLDFESDTGQSIVNADCGFVVEPENIEKLSQKMKEVAKLNPNDLIRMGNNGYKFAIENLSKEGNLNKITAFIIDTRGKLQN